MKPRPKKHLADGCKAGESRERLSHRRFVGLPGTLGPSSNGC